MSTSAPALVVVVPSRAIASVSDGVPPAAASARVAMPAHRRLAGGRE